MFRRICVRIVAWFDEGVSADRKAIDLRDCNFCEMVRHRIGMIWRLVTPTRHTNTMAYYPKYKVRRPKHNVEL